MDCDVCNNINHEILTVTSGDSEVVGNAVGNTCGAETICLDGVEGASDTIVTRPTGDAAPN